jgi:peptidyl-prolyl cis-trans isomerase A (cyclophilin A)/peptidyl-prolyl cis-trans isomerase B (cyclophilin B)
MHPAHRTTFAYPRLLACLLLALGLTGCGGGDADATASGGPDGAARGRGASGVAAASAPVPERYAGGNKTTLPVVRLTTSLGPIDIRLDPEAAAVTVRNFLNYVRSHHYDQTVFHYVEDGKIILGGGYLADGSPKPAGPPILNEAHNGRQNKAGTIAMARDAGVIDSATSQFFINLQDAPHLDHSGDTPAEYGYCVFGEVIDGLDVARQISAIGSKTEVIAGEELSVPAKTVRIESVKVLR